MKPATGARAGSRSSALIPSISWCWPRNGATAAAPANSRICISAPSIRPRGEYVMLGKTFKGLTDAMLDWQTKEFLARETHRDPVDGVCAARNSSWRSPSAICRRAPAIRAAWRCVLRE